MIETRNEKLIGAIRILGGSVEGKEFFDWLKKNEEYYENVERGIKDEIELRWMQGKLQCLSDINELIQKTINPEIQEKKHQAFKSGLLY